jgi:hypothetical protein
MNPMAMMEEFWALVTHVFRGARETVCRLVEGLLLAPRSRVTTALQTLVELPPKHYTTYHKFFYRGRWNVDFAGLRLLEKALPWAAHQRPVLVIDDSLFNHTSLAMFGSQVHHDNARSSRKIRQLGVGYRWVILS